MLFAAAVMLLVIACLNSRGTTAAAPVWLFPPADRHPALHRTGGAARHQATEPADAPQRQRVEDALDRTLVGRRFSLIVIAAFGLTALVLAGLGVYGLIAFAVTQRTKEIGIRLALGAGSREVMTMIVRRGLVLALSGTVIGALAALFLSRLVQGLLFGVSVRDPIAFAAVTAITVGAVVIASYLPARRALKSAPVESLRSA
jgi:ABC-type antimicrobial peptide transport system permease subunit